MIPASENPATSAAPDQLDPEALTEAQINAIVHLRLRPPACIRSLTFEAQIRFLKREQDQAVAQLRSNPELEERATPRLNPDGTMARDPKTRRILYDLEHVPVAEKEIERCEDMLNQVRAQYAAQLRVGPEARAARADAEARYLVQQFGSPEEQRAVPRQIIADVSAAFRRLKGWN